MTKIYYLSRGNFGSEYFLDDGCYGSRRDSLGNDSDYLINNLKKRLGKSGFKRKTNFCIVKENFPEEKVKEIRKLFSDSRVKVSLVSLLDFSDRK